MTLTIIFGEKVRNKNEKKLLTEAIKLFIKRIEENKTNDNWDEFVRQFYFKSNDNFYVVSNIDLVDLKIEYDEGTQYDYFDGETIVYKLEED